MIVSTLQMAFLRATFVTVLIDIAKISVLWEVLVSRRRVCEDASAVDFDLSLFFTEFKYIHSYLYLPRTNSFAIFMKTTWYNLDVAIKCEPLKNMSFVDPLRRQIYFPTRATKYVAVNNVYGFT